MLLTLGQPSVFLPFRKRRLVSTFSTNFKNACSLHGPKDLQKNGLKILDFLWGWYVCTRKNRKPVDLKLFSLKINLVQSIAFRCLGLNFQQKVVDFSESKISLIN